MRVVRWMLPAASALLMSACVVAPYGPAPGNDEPVATTEAPPPPPQVEVVPVVPFAGAIWIGGYWGWGGGRYHWVPGRWEHPRVGFVWAPFRWVPFHGRWHLRGGWRRG